MADSTETSEDSQVAEQHAPFLAHHFDTPTQQFDAGKLGMWLFLLTEILFFGGLFCAYTIYRSHHPEIFTYGHQYLDKNLGAINTAVLIFSSLTMAWGVRCAQCSQQRGLIVCLAITLLCAFAFLGIKYVEYKAKWEHGLLPGYWFNPTEAEHGVEAPDGEASDGEDETHGVAHASEQVKNRHLFFGIYFTMTGLHAAHIIGGMIAIVWLLVRAGRGHFSSAYFGPVDFVGLYWHLVDLIWIFLFPLLYLIG